MKRIKLFLMAAIVAVFAGGLAAQAAEKAEIKYSLAIYHYNLEYVAGDTEIENRIIEGSLDPMLDLFLDHPGWGADFEMQGYMIVETAKRFPEIFAKLETLVQRGQISLVSFHYADQLFLAYPAHDMAWSHRLNRRVFEKYGLEQAGAVFAQEGQFGEGMAKFMGDHGFETLVLPKNLYRHAHGEEEAQPYYSLNGISAILGGRGVDYEDGGAVVKTTWSYLNDAELLPTGGATPYAQSFGYVKEAVEKYEAKLEAHEAAGYTIGTIDEYIRDLKEAGVDPAKLKPMIDGAWQPVDTQNLFRWMGNYLAAFERDNEILTNNVRVRHRLVAAELVAGHLEAAGFDTAGMQGDIAEAWRRQSHATVSDSTGWTPFPIEIEYVEDYSAGVEEIVDRVISEAKELLGARTLVADIESGAVRMLDAPPAETDYERVDCPVDFQLTGEYEQYKYRCVRVSDSAVRLDMRFMTKNSSKNNMRLSFPRTVDHLLFSPGLWEESYVRYDDSVFDPEDSEFYIPCSNGLIALEDDLFLIKKTDTIHVTYRYPFGEKTIDVDMNRPPSKGNVWQFYFFRGAPEDAVRFANSVNVYPEVTF